MIITNCIATGNYNQAIDYSQKLLTLAEKQQNLITKETALSYLNNLYRIVGKPEKALEISKQLLQLAQAKNDPQNEWTAWQQLALNYTEAGNTEKAIEAFQKALEITKKTNNIFGQAENLKSLSIVYAYLQNYPKALEFQNQSFALYQQYFNNRNNLSLQFSLLNAAQIYLKNKQFSQAEKEHQLGKKNENLLFAPLQTNQFAHKLEQFIRKAKRYNADLYKFALHEGYLPKHLTELLQGWRA